MFSKLKIELLLFKLVQVSKKSFDQKNQWLESLKDLMGGLDALPVNWSLRRASQSSGDSQTLGLKISDANFENSKLAIF